MKGIKNFTVLFIFQLWVSISYVMAFDKMECKGAKIKMDDGEKAIMKSCAKESGVTDMMELTMEKLGCFSKCNFEKQGLVDDEGHPHKENILKRIKTMVDDEKMGESLKMSFEKCLDENGPKLKPKEKSCSSYILLSTCVQGAMMKLCFPTPP